MYQYTNARQVYYDCDNLKSKSKAATSFALKYNELIKMNQGICECWETNQQFGKLFIQEIFQTSMQTAKECMEIANTKEEKEKIMKMINAWIEKKVFDHEKIEMVKGMRAKWNISYGTPVTIEFVEVKEDVPVNAGPNQQIGWYPSLQFSQSNMDLYIGFDPNNIRHLTPAYVAGLVKGNVMKQTPYMPLDAKNVPRKMPKLELSPQDREHFKNILDEFKLNKNVDVTKREVPVELVKRKNISPEIKPEVKSTKKAAIAFVYEDD